LPLDHRRVGNRLRREVIVGVEIGLLHQLPRRASRVAELPQFVRR
jgi:hypothetical protein